MGQDSINDSSLTDQVSIFLNCKYICNNLVLRCEEIEIMIKLMSDKLYWMHRKDGLRLLHASHDLIGTLIEKLKSDFDELLTLLRKIVTISLMYETGLNDDLILSAQHIEAIIEPLLYNPLETYGIDQIQRCHAMIDNSIKKLKSKLTEAYYSLEQMSEIDFIEDA